MFFAITLALFAFSTRPRSQALAEGTVETGSLQSATTPSAMSSTTSSAFSVNTAALDTLAGNCFANEGCEDLYYLFDRAFGTWSPSTGPYPGSQVTRLQSAICEDGSSGIADPWGNCDSCMSSVATMLGIGGSPITSIHQARLAKDQLCLSSNSDASTDLDNLLSIWDVFSSFWYFIAATNEGSSSLSAPPSMSSSSNLESTFHPSTIPLTFPSSSSSSSSSLSSSPSSTLLSATSASPSKSTIPLTSEGSQTLASGTPTIPMESSTGLSSTVAPRTTHSSGAIAQTSLLDTKVTLLSSTIIAPIFAYLALPLILSIFTHHRWFLF